jgi:hypothetical protein
MKEAPVMFSIIKRRAAVVTLALGVAASASLVAGPAQAADSFDTLDSPAGSSAAAAKTTSSTKPMEIKSLTVSPSSRAVSKKGNQSYNVYANWKQNSNQLKAISIKFPLWRGKKFVKNVYAHNVNGASFKLNPKSSSMHFGHFTFKNPQVTVRYTNDKKVRYTVGVKKTFSMKAAISGSLHIKRNGTKYHFSASTKYYSGVHQKKVAYNPRGARLQYKSGGHWKNYGSALTFKHGKWTSYKHFGSRHTWRVSVPATTSIVGGRTSSVTI